jgi:serine/threonine-protein kinase
VLLDVLAGLGAAHAAGVLHRDLKPHNLLSSATGDIRLGDFGAAYLQGLGATRTESFIGTLAYMAPEQLSGQPLSFATDLYALAVTAFQLLTGRLPFPGPDFIGQHLHATPPDPRSYVPSLDECWSALLRRALHKSPTDRYASLEELRNELLALPLTPDAHRPTAALPTSPPPSDRAPNSVSTPNRDHVWLEGASPVLQTPHSTVALGLDLRLGRPVLVERFHPTDPSSPALRAHLQWLRTLAGLAGPGLQRILRIDLGHRHNGNQTFEVHYEVPVGPHAGPDCPLTLSDVNLLHRTLRRLHAAGIPHGHVQSSVLCEPTAALLLLHGRGPLQWPTPPPSPQDDLDQLAQLHRS